jgi:hypothetical protein
MNVQLPVVIHVQPVEFRLHKGHELLLGDFAILVRIHQEQQLFGRWHSSVDLLWRSVQARPCPAPAARNGTTARIIGSEG